MLTKASTIQRSFLEGVLGTLGLFSSRLRLADWTFHTNSTHGFLKGKMRGETSPVPFLHFPQPSSQSPPSIERHPCGLKGVPSIYRMRGRKNSRKFLKSSFDPAMLVRLCRVLEHKHIEVRLRQPEKIQTHQLLSQNHRTTHFLPP